MKALYRLTLFIFFSLSLMPACAGKFKTQRWTTKNGVPVVFYQTMNVPMLTIQMAFDAGSARDEHKFGLSALTSSMLDQGNAGKSATAIAESLADTGAQFSAGSSRDMVTLQLKTLTEPAALRQATKTFAAIIGRADFPQKAFNRVKKEQLNAIKQFNQSPNNVAAAAFYQALYQNHPYAHPILGTNDTVSVISRNDVVDFYQRHYTAANAVLVIVGAVDESKARRIAHKLTAPLQKGVALWPVPKAKMPENTKKESLAFPSTQTILQLGQLGITHHDPDYFPLQVGNYILGGGTLVSRLALIVREKNGLSYNIDSAFVPMPGTGPFMINLATKGAQASKALSLTEQTIKNYVKNGPDEKELKAAKQYLTGSFPLSLASNQSIAGMLLKMMFYQLPDDFLDTYVDKINAVSIEDIDQAFKRHIKPEKLFVIKVGRA